jgi:nitrile hydratase
MLAPGSAVKVKNDWPETRGPCHIRTPHYLRGRVGKIVRYLGDFPNPEDLAFARPAPNLPLYHVAFDTGVLWGADAAPATEILVEIYEPWLEPA